MRYVLFAAALLVVLAIGFQSAPVRAAGAPQLTVFVPHAGTFVRGGIWPLVVAVDRTEYLQPVTVTVAGLPGGVTAEENPKSVRTQPGVFIFNVSPTAPIVNDLPIIVIAVGHDGAVVTQQVRLTIRD